MKHEMFTRDYSSISRNNYSDQMSYTPRLLEFLLIFFSELTPSKSSPDIYIKRQRNGLRVKYGCEVCEKVFRTRFKLNQHISIEHKMGPKMPENEPNMGPKKEYELVKLHDCPKCEKSYEELKRLNKHISKHHCEEKKDFSPKLEING